MLEVTFGLVKPDAYVHREQILEEFILPSRLSVICRKDPYFFTEEIVREHYKIHEAKPFFPDLIAFTLYGLSGLNSSRHGKKRKAPTSLFVLEGDDAVRVLDEITGPTKPGVAKFQARESRQKTIRSEYGNGMPDNAFHCSDSYKSARREIMIYFKRDELPEYVWEMLEKEPYV